MKNNFYILNSYGGQRSPLIHVALLLQKGKVPPDIQLNTWKYNDWGIKLETNVMRLHKLQVEKISSL